MTKNELRASYLELTKLETIEDCQKLLDIYLEYYLLIAQKQLSKAYTRENADAKLINQMVFTKGTHIKKILEGSGFNSVTGSVLSPIIDPTILVSLIRNLYETVCLFHLIYVDSQTDDEKQIRYNLWVVSGLKYRQRFSEQATTSENIQKVEDERNVIDDIENKIYTNPIYTSLPELEQKKLQKFVSDKVYALQFDNNKVIKLSWQQMAEVMGCKEDFVAHVYTYFSLFAHPSNVAVFNFEAMFRKANEEYKIIVRANMRFCFAMLSIFIADYIKVFPELKDIYEELNLIDQIVLNQYNKLVRGDEYSINDSWTNLN